jgi:hypothetical protein
VLACECIDKHWTRHRGDDSSNEAVSAPAERDLVASKCCNGFMENIFESGGPQSLQVSSVESCWPPTNLGKVKKLFVFEEPGAGREKQNHVDTCLTKHISNAVR